MSDFFEMIALSLQDDFVQNALIVGALISLSSSLLGIILVLKNFSFIGDGLSRVTFAATAIASILRLSSNNNMFVVLPVTMLCAILLLRPGQSSRIRGDAVIALISVSGMALGYLVLTKFPTSNNLSKDVCTTLFGSASILMLSRTQVWLSVALSIAVVAIFVVFYNKIFAVTFDESFAHSAGTRVTAYNLLIAVVIATIIVLAMNLVGSLLISALIIFPAMSAMRLFKSFRSVTICAAVFSVVCSLLGILVASGAGTPVGSTIVAIDLIGFFVFCLISRIRRRA